MKQQQQQSTVQDARGNVVEAKSANSMAFHKALSTSDPGISGVCLRSVSNHRCICVVDAVHMGVRATSTEI